MVVLSLLSILYITVIIFAAGAWDSDKGEITTNLECGQEECH